MCYATELHEIQPRLFNYVRSRVCNVSDASDVVQETNQVLINKEDQYNSSYSFRSWALGIAKWQILAYFKRQKRAVPTFSLDVREGINPNWLSEMPFSTLIKKERVELIKGLNHVLSRRQKEIFNLLIEGLTNQEIADAIGTTQKNVQSTKSRLIERIRNFVSNNQNEHYHNY